MQKLSPKRKVVWLSAALHNSISNQVQSSSSLLSDFEIAVIQAFTISWVDERAVDKYIGKDATEAIQLLFNGTYEPLYSKNTGTNLKTYLR